jgi:hypothetical protein
MTGHASVENPFAGQGAVLLDIGGEIGALVVTMPATLLGTEVEIRPVGTTTGSHAHGHDQGHDHGHHHHDAGEHLAHVAVVNRPVGDGHVPSLVFPELGSGRYELFAKGDGDHVVLEADVTGGEVSTVTWPA